MVMLDVLPYATLPILLGKCLAPCGEKPWLKSAFWRFLQLLLSDYVLSTDCCPHFSGESLYSSE